VFSHVFEQITYGVAVVAGDSFYGADSVFLNQKFAYCYDFGFGEVFVVERGKYSFCEKVAAVEAFVDLMACTVFSIPNDIFSLFLQVISALYVLTSYRNDTSWARHNTLQIRSPILTNLN
jgi:hypothetical protein